MVEQSIDKLVEHIPVNTHILKAVEECAELQEVLVKYLTKSELLKPKMDKITEEMGDVVFRIMVLARSLGVEDDVQGRMDFKAKVLFDWAVNKFEKQN